MCIEQAGVLTYSTNLFTIFSTPTTETAKVNTASERSEQIRARSYHSQSLMRAESVYVARHWTGVEPST